MKIIKIFLVAFAMTSFACYGQTNMDIFSAVKQYMDPTILSAYEDAFAANKEDPNGMPESGFQIEYTMQHPEFAQAVEDATNKAMEELGIKDPEDLVKSLKDSIDDLKKQIEDNKKLSEEQKKEMEEQLEQYKDALNQMKQQLANTQNNNGGGGGGGSTPPQMQDIMQMIMQILQKLMGGCSGGGGGGGG